MKRVYQNTSDCRKSSSNQVHLQVLGNDFSCTYYFKRCQRKRLTRIGSLPDDLLFEILVRLPAQDIYDHARFVCWKWYRMIHTRKFLYEHFKHVTYGLLFYLNCEPPFFMTEKQGRIEISRLNYKLTSVWLTCNGLVLEVESPNLCTLCARNPITKQKLILPRPPLRRSIIYPPWYGIACSAVSMDYKVVFVDFAFWRPYLCFILTVGVDESWRKVEIEHLSPTAVEELSYIPLITEGFMHWIKTGSLILTLNIETEIFTEIPVRVPRDQLPLKKERSRHYLSTGMYLSMLIGCGVLWDVFEMEPETGEWREVCSFALKGSFDLQHEHSLVPLGWLKYPEVLVFYIGHTFFFYNLLTQKIDWLESLSTPLSPCRITTIYMMAHKNSLCWFSGC